MTKSYEIRYSNGRVDGGYETYEDAVEQLRCDGCEEIGHDGDLSDGGDRTLAWLTEADALDDDGARAYASIRVEGR